MKHHLASIILLICMVSCKPAEPVGKMIVFSGKAPLSVINQSINDEQIVSCLSNRQSVAVYLDGPTLLSISSDECNTVHIYKPEDADQLDVRIEGDLLYINGIVRSIFMEGTNSTEFADWYRDASSDAVRNLRIIYGREWFAEYDRLLEINPQLLIFIDGGTNSPPTTPKGQPYFLYLDDSMPKDALQQLDISQTRVLMIDADSPEFVNTLAQIDFPRVSTLLIQDSSNIEKLLPNFSNIRSLSLSAKQDLPPLSTFHNLRALHLDHEDVESPIPLESLFAPQQIQALTVPGLDCVTGLAKLTGLRYLDPGNSIISAEILKELVANHPELICLNLSDCTVDTLDPLMDAKNLEAVIIGNFPEDTMPDYSALQHVRSLRFIGLQQEAGEDADVVAQLQTICPECLIYIQDGFCLGSGWILIILPFLLILLAVKHFRPHHTK